MSKNRNISNILDQATTFAVSAAVGANVVANTTVIMVGNSSVNVTINSTTFSGTANNAAYLGGTAAADYQTEAGLAANVATMTANNAAYLGGTAAADYQTEAGLAANVAVLTANNANYLGGTAAADYQTEAGLAANVATMSANNAAYLGGLAAASWANLSSATFTVQAAVGANVSANLTTIRVGNSAVNTVVGNNTIYVGNSTNNTSINSLAIVIGTSTVNATVLAAGANVIANTTAFMVGNSSVNAVVNSTSMIIGSSTVNSTTVSVGSTVVNSTVVNSAAVYVAGAVVLTASGADQSITGGARVTVNDLGNLSGTTKTPDPGDRPMQKITNNGAGTIAPGSNYGNYILDVINTTGAGAITTSGWTKVSGDSFDTTTTSKFRCYASVTADMSVLSIIKAV